MKTNIHNYIVLMAIILLNSCKGDNAYGPMGNQGYGWPWMMHYGFRGMFMWIIFIILMGALFMQSSTCREGEAPGMNPPWIF
jgi:hypothetical protein